ncbi:MAG: DUF3450 family protein [Elusimicrobia bacterium]|nr:DUF3450 family protein [Elusimicrobiota bacterium]
MRSESLKNATMNENTPYRPTGVSPLKRGRFIIFVLAVFFCFSSVRAHTGNGLEKLNNLKEKLRKERIARVNDKIANYNKLKSLEMKVYSLEDKLAEIKTRKLKLEDELSKAEEEESEIKRTCNESEAAKKEIENFLEDKRKEIADKIKNGFPYKKEARIEKLKNVKDIRGFFSFLKYEIVLGRKCEVYTAKIEGEDAEVFRAGWIFAVSKSTDGSFALLKKRARRAKIEYRWNKIRKGLLTDKLSVIFRAVEGGINPVREFLPNSFTPLDKKTSLTVFSNGVNKAVLPLDVTQGTKLFTRETKGGLWGWFKRGGPVMIFIALVAVAIIAMTIERLLFFKKEYIDADVLMERVVGLWNKGHRDDAIDLCKRTQGPVARMLFDALVKHRDGKEIMEEAIHQRHLEEMPRLSRHLPAIAVLAGMSPLLGLLGTVSGMISTFQIITYHGGGNPRLLAGGISEALITTEFGLIVAIPALLIHSYLSGKASQIASDMEKNAVKLTNSLQD